jgi:hypothetical protein
VKGGEGMEETLAGIVTELERVIRPLGFRIEAIHRHENGRVLIGSDADNADNAELVITIVRKGKVNWVSLSTPESPVKVQ